MFCQMGVFGLGEEKSWERLHSIAKVRRMLRPAEAMSREGGGEGLLQLNPLFGGLMKGPVHYLSGLIGQVVCFNVRQAYASQMFRFR